MIFKSSDKKLEELGFVKNSENPDGVKFFIDIQNENGCKSKHILFIGKSFYGEYVIKCGKGLTYKEMKAAMRKYREMKRKYGWK